MFSAEGEIKFALSGGDGVNEAELSETIDVERGQSGSGVWTTLEGDNQPRILGVISETEEDSGEHFIPLITPEIYKGITEIMEKDDGTDDANVLPENAIVGSANDDTIEGSYRRERILGNEGQDTILGGDADDRLEGGNGNDVLRGEKGNDRLQGDGGNDFLDGGEGDIDVAVFSDDYTVENYDYEEITGSTFGVVDELITIDHIGGTGADGKDTLDGIEWGLFESGAEDLENQAFIPQEAKTNRETQHLSPQIQEKPHNLA